jgi:hypothetical protein
MKRIVFLFIAAWSSCASAAQAGTTGALAGKVIDAMTGRPIAGATITAASPSDVQKAVSDAAGDYVFVSLQTGTYVISVAKRGYEPASYAGVQVSADRENRVTLHTYPRLITLTEHFDRRRSALVRSGMTADMYSLPPHYPHAGSGNSAFDFIIFVPGITMGAGIRVMP